MLVTDYLSSLFPEQTKQSIRQYQTVSYEFIICCQKRRRQQETTDPGSSRQAKKKGRKEEEVKHRAAEVNPAAARCGSHVGFCVESPQRGKTDSVYFQTGEGSAGEKRAHESKQNNI